VSGSGTILQSILESGLVIAVVGSDRECRALDVAREAGIDTLLLDRGNFGGFSKDFDRSAYTVELAQQLVDRSIDLVAMAGFGTILSGEFHDAFPGRVLNTHPSLLPLYKGWHAVRQALEEGAKETGCTVHIATAALDEGPILAQAAVPILPSDDEETLHERIKQVERSLYPSVLHRVVDALIMDLEPLSMALS
jgi:phosphoribosylglycinamide formyltransferase-1